LNPNLNNFATLVFCDCATTSLFSFLISVYLSFFRGYTVPIYNIGIYIFYICIIHMSFMRLSHSLYSVRAKQFIVRKIVMKDQLIDFIILWEFRSHRKILVTYIYIHIRFVNIMKRALKTQTFFPIRNKKVGTYLKFRNCNALFYRNY